MKEKRIDSGQVQYTGGQKAYPVPKWTVIYFYEYRFVLEEYNLTVRYDKIKDILNTTGKQREADHLALGIIALRFALTYLWKKATSIL